MVDTFSLLLSHALVLLAFWRVRKRPELDQEEAEVPQPIAQSASIPTDA